MPTFEALIASYNARIEREGLSSRGMWHWTHWAAVGGLFAALAIGDWVATEGAAVLTHLL
jgi:hypothetical protein